MRSRDQRAEGRGRRTTRSTPYALRLTLYATLYALCAMPFGCGQNRSLMSPKVISYREEQPTPFDLALRFAPRVYVNPTEPYRLEDLIVFIHPQRPLIAYHLLWEDDSIGPGRGKEGDHEIAWVEYDPISLKLVDVWALWHRGILHTDESVIEAKDHHQRPKFFVQWGQHGMLPVGWEKLSTARPRAELRLHFALSKSIQLGPYTGSKNIDSLKFQGDYCDYLTFSELVDLRQYVRPAKVIVGADSNAVMSEMISYSISLKEPWPY